MKRCSFLVAIILLLMCSSEALAERLPIEVQSTLSGKLSERLAYSLKEKIRASSFFDYTYDLKQARAVVYLNSMDLEDGTFIFSVIVTMLDPSTNRFPLLIDATIGSYGHKKIHEAAEDLTAFTVKTLEPFIKFMENQMRRE